MEETKKSGLSTAGLILGIIAICVSFIPFVNYLSIIMGILAIIFGIIGIIKNAGKGMAIAALVLGILSMIITYNSYKTMANAITDTVNTFNDGLNSTTEETNSDSITNEPVKIGLGDVITGKDVEVNIESAQFSQSVEPPVKNMYYNYYQVKDSNNTYLYLILNCKNTSTINLDAEGVANVIAKYNNAYTYSSFSAIPDDTLGFTYTSLTNIKPLTSQKIYYLMEMPKTIADETDTPVEINIKVDNTTYTYQYR